MPCPNCDRTLAGLIDAPVGGRKWHCQYCGTLVLESGCVQDVTVPKLVRHPQWITPVTVLLNAVEAYLRTQDKERLGWVETAVANLREMN